MQAASPERRLDDGPTPPHSRSKMSASLPLEILPLILQQLSSANRLSTLATCSLVCQTWSQFTRPYLWRRLWFRSQDRVHKVFSVLGEHPDLCSLVKIIELRVFPFGLPAGQAEQLEENICRALNWMHNLEELTWTRTGSLSNRILPDLLTGREKLHTLEVTGNTRFFDVDLLWKGVSHRGEQGFPLPNLRHISFVLPDSAAIKALIELAKRATLKSVLIFCHHSTVFQNVHAELLSESLAHVEKLEIVGCRRLEADALRKMVSSSQNGIRMLKLEGCGVHPSQLPTLAGPLSRNLRALSLTLPRPSFCPHSEFYTHLATLVSSLDNLTDFTLYAPGGVRAGDGDGGIDDADAGDGEAGPHDDFHDTAAQQHSNSTTTTEQSSTTHLVPKMPLSFLRSLLTSRETGLPHRRLTRLRVYGIICSAQGLKLVGSDAGPDLSGSHHTQQHTGLRDLVVQLESGPVVSRQRNLWPCFTMYLTHSPLYMPSLALTAFYHRFASPSRSHSTDAAHPIASRLGALLARRRCLLDRKVPRQSSFAQRLWTAGSVRFLAHSSGTSKR